MSLRGSAWPSVTTSGALHAGRPEHGIGGRQPGEIGGAREAEVAQAHVESRPGKPTSTFDGLTSRCTTPARVRGPERPAELGGERPDVGGVEASGARQADPRGRPRGESP